MITIKTQEEIEIMSHGGKILATTLKKISEMAKPGITTLELDKIAEDTIISMGGEPAFKGYAKFPYSLCASVNDEVVHCFPSERVLQEGDIISLDLGVIYKGFCTDSAVTVPVGNISFDAQRLLKNTKKALLVGLREVKAGNTTGDIGYAIERFIARQNLGLVRDLTGHGIGRTVHEDPAIPNHGGRHAGVELKEGMTICIEPMAVMGSPKLKKAQDGYGLATKDKSLAAHFEHTVVVTKNGCRILTEV